MQTLGKFHKTRLGHLVFGLVELGIASVAANRAFGDGNLWLWALALICLVGFLQNFIRMITGSKQ